MGTGTNVQKRLVALHHLDAPWKPAEVEQREGRILRQGNENEEVAIYRYVTEGSFDAYMWQALETKARFIAQVITGDNAARRAEDIGGQELSYAEVKAIASGNPAVLTLAEADAELQRLTLLKKNHLDEQYVARRNVRDLPGTIERLTDDCRSLKQTWRRLKASSHAFVTIAGREIPRDEASTALGKRLDSLPEQVFETTRISLGTFRGMGFGIVLHPSFAPEVYLAGAATRTTDAIARAHGPRAVLNALERLAGSRGQQLQETRRETALAEGQLRDYRSRLGKPFIHKPYRLELAKLRDALKAGLTRPMSVPEGDAKPTVAELAEQVKKLRRLIRSRLRRNAWAIAPCRLLKNRSRVAQGRRIAIEAADCPAEARGESIETEPWSAIRSAGQWSTTGPRSNRPGGSDGSSCGDGTGFKDWTTNFCRPRSSARQRQRSLF